MNPQETLQHQLSDLRQAFTSLQEELALTETSLSDPDRPGSQPMVDQQAALQRRFLTLQTGIREFGHTLDTLYSPPAEVQAARQTHSPFSPSSFPSSSPPASPPSFPTVAQDSVGSSSAPIDQVMTTFLHDAEHTIPVVMSAFFETRAYDSTFSLAWSNPTGLEEDLQTEAQNQIERGTFAAAFQHNAALVCASHGLHHYHPRVRALILVPLTATPIADGIIVVATEREANNIEAAQLARLDTLAQRATGNGKAPHVEAQEQAPSAKADGEDISEQHLTESPQASTLDSDIFNGQQPPQLTPVTVVHTHDSSEQERPASSRIVPRWMLFAIFTLGLFLAFPFLRRQLSPQRPVQPEKQQSVSTISRTPRTAEPSVPFTHMPAPSLLAPASVQDRQTAQAAPPVRIPADTPGTVSDPRLPPPLTRVHGPHTLNIQSTQEVWLSVIIDQVVTKETFLKPGEQVIWVANTDFVVSVDKPEGVRLIFNGNELAPLSERGQRRLPLHLPPAAADTEKAG